MENKQLFTQAFTLQVFVARLSACNVGRRGIPKQFTFSLRGCRLMTSFSLKQEKNVDNNVGSEETDLLSHAAGGSLGFLTTLFHCRTLHLDAFHHQPPLTHVQHPEDRLPEVLASLMTVFCCVD